MIADVDAAMRALIGTRTYPGERIQVDLDPPTKDWAARRSGPVLNLFLNDVREDTGRRTANYLDIRNDEGIIISRRPSERTFMFTYALSAWTSRPEDDHDLLGAALINLLQYEHIPQEYTSGMLHEITCRHHPAILRVGGLMFSERLSTELWSAIGGEYRPTIAVTVSVEIPTGLAVIAGPRQTEPPRFVFNDTVSGSSSTLAGPSPTAPLDADGNPVRERRRGSLAEESKPAAPARKKK